VHCGLPASLGLALIADVSSTAPMLIGLGVADVALQPTQGADERSGAAEWSRAGALLFWLADSTRSAFRWLRAYFIRCRQPILY